MPLWEMSARLRAGGPGVMLERWVCRCHLTTASGGVVALWLLFGPDRCLVNQFPERTLRFGSSGSPTSNLSRSGGCCCRCSAAHLPVCML